MVYTVAGHGTGHPQGGAPQEARPNPQPQHLLGDAALLGLVPGRGGGGGLEDWRTGGLEDWLTG